MKNRLILLGATIMFCIICLVNLPAVASDRFSPIDFRRIQIGGELGRRMDITINNNLLVLNADRDFLAPFQARQTKESYIGLGKLIDATIHFAANRSDPSLLAFKQHLVDATLKTQDSDGYIGLFPPDKRMFTLWDIHEMSYLILALSADYQFFGESRSLQAAKKLADYILACWSKEPNRDPSNGQIAVHVAVTGSENAFLQLYQQTGDRRYLDFVRDFRKLAEWEGRIVVGRWGTIEGHAYAYLCRCVAQMRLDRLEPDSHLLEPTRKISDFMLNRDGLVISGAVGDHECWHDSQEGRINLGETCATAYLIRFWDELLRREGDSVYGDLMERSIYNALFAAQSPDGRRLRYYAPFEHPRSYYDGDTYCCPCNYRRIIAELPGLIFYGTDAGIAVNLYTPCQATIPLEAGLSVKIMQQTRYPADGHVTLLIEPSRPARFPLQLRIPSWCKQAMVTIQGKPTIIHTVGGQFCKLDREWHSGDQVSLDFKMPWRLVKGRKAQSGRVAVMRGPLVFGLSAARNPDLTTMDLASIVLDSRSMETASVDANIHPDGQVCRVQAWKPGDWYPFSKTSLTLTLTEFADPGLVATFFKVPNPNAADLVEDELDMADLLIR